MRKNFGTKSWFYPLPVLIIATFNEDGTADAMNAAWGGLYDADKVVLCLSAGHKTTENIQKRRAFTVSFADAAHVIPADYVGMVSAHNEADKMEKAGFHVTKSEYVDAPLIDELPVALECRFIKVTEDGNIIGQIVNVSAEENVLDADGSIDFTKFHPISFEPAHNAYHVLGEKVGNAFQAWQSTENCGDFITAPQPFTGRPRWKRDIRTAWPRSWTKPGRNIRWRITSFPLM